MSDELAVWVGAEGVSEIAGEAWWREATPDEVRAFAATHGAVASIDGIGRPSWLLVVGPEAPAEARRRAAASRRVTRLVD